MRSLTMKDAASRARAAGICRRVAAAGLCLGLLTAASVRPPAVTALANPQPPQVLFQDLFSSVQNAQLFADSKTFADAVPRRSPPDILANYQESAPASAAALASFVAANFTVPGQSAAPTLAAERVTITRHIDSLWDQLTRSTPTAPPYSSLLPVPEPYVVPGGRFHEMYYWDSYFTMLGLVESGRHDLAENMVRDFAYLIDTYGHVPNGTRSYYLSRSQPPFFFAMVGLLSGTDPAASYARYLPQLRREYAFWMEGEAGLQPGTAHRRVVAMADGAVLNRYWDDADTPRDESYREDTQLAVRSGRSPRQLYRDIRAAAESGWDFSSRWFADGRSLATINTTEIIPIDLNSLLFGLEKAISAGGARAGDEACAKEFTHRAAARRDAVNRYLWDAAAGVYHDYQWVKRTQVPRISAATLYPLFVALAARAQARAVATAVSRDLLKAGGIVTTPLLSGQQWDAPNGWAPLQWIGVSGLRQYSILPLAQTIACRWIQNIERVYGESGKLVEKYDVLATGRPGGGGEYPLQDGFGSTNGVTRKLMALYPKAAAQATPGQCPVAVATTRAGENESFDLQPARGVVQRLVPGLADRLRLGTLAPQAGSERFRISSADGRPEIRGSSPSALLYGVNWYLKYLARISVTTNGIRIGQLESLPLPAAPIERETRATIRYALNENTDGYSTPYWDWSRWEHEIDLLALSGVNAMIIERGSAEVLYQTFREFGYTDQAAREWLTLPAHLNWQLMGNVCCFGGPASRSLLRRQLKSAQQIIGRLRELSITPVLPGFYGIVPADFRRLFPAAHVVPQGEWAGFTRPGWLDPRDPLFGRIAASYYRHQHALLGDSDIYDMEVFQEGGTAGDVPVAQGARLVQSALATAHPKAKWMMLAWEGNPKPELLTAVDRRRLLIIDIDHNRVRRDDRQHDFQDAPFLFGGLWEFGGRTTLGTDLANITERLPAMAHANSNMTGTALFSEGLDTNPFIFDLFTEMAWHEDAVDAAEWTRAYVVRRYGAADAHALAAWQILLHTAYDLRVEGISFNSERDAGQESLFAAEPSLTANRASNWSPEAMRYDPIAFQGALAELLAVAPALRQGEGFRYDLVDVARQALANESRQLLPRIATAYHDRDLAGFHAQTARWLELMDLQDELLATHNAFLLGAWLAPVAAWASDPAERAQLEYDARSILTTWGDRHASADARLHDYGNKDWAGLTQGYYRVRWARYFAALDQELLTGMPGEPIDWFALGDAWNHGSEDYPTRPVGDAYTMATRVARALHIADAAPHPQLAPGSS